MQEELKKEYLLLFNGISETIGNLEKMVLQLQRLQQDAENCVLEDDRETFGRRQIHNAKERYKKSCSRLIDFPSQEVRIKQEAR